MEHMDGAIKPIYETVFDSNLWNETAAECARVTNSSTLFLRRRSIRTLFRATNRVSHATALARLDGRAGLRGMAKCIRRIRAVEAIGMVAAICGFAELGSADEWGALAYSVTEERAATGAATSQPTQAAAEKAALDDCVAYGGDHCQIAAVFGRGGCGYITFGRGPEGSTGFAVGYGASPEAADRNCRAQGAVSCEAPVGGCTAQSSATSAPSLCDVTSAQPLGPTTVSGRVSVAPQKVAAEFVSGRGDYSLELSDPRPSSGCTQPTLRIFSDNAPSCGVGQMVVASGTGDVVDVYFGISEYMLSNATIECH